MASRRQNSPVSVEINIFLLTLYRPPPLCGAISAENSYIAKMGDLVAARVKERDGDENWILAEVLNFQSSTNKYEIMDIDEEGKEYVLPVCFTVS